MASYRIEDFSPRADKKVKLRVRVFPTGADTENDAESVLTFDVLLNAQEVKDAFALTGTQAQNAALKELFEADPRITGILLSEEATDLLKVRFELPIVITIN